MKVGDKVYIRAKKNPNGSYKLADYANDDATVGYTEQLIVSVFEQAKFGQDRFCVNCFPKGIVVQISGQDHWWTHKANLTPVSDYSPNTLRSSSYSTSSIVCIGGCGNGSTYAEPNCKNGQFVCWSCRSAYGWKFKELLIG